MHMLSRQDLNSAKLETVKVLQSDDGRYSQRRKSMECYCYLRNIQDLLSGGKTPYERRFGIPFNGPVIPFGALVQYHPISSKDLSRLHQFGPKVLPGVFLGHALNAGWIWKGDITVADSEELEQIDASEIHARRLNAEEVSTPMKGQKFIFPAADGILEKIRIQDHPPESRIVWNEERNKKFFEENQDSLLHHHNKRTQHEMMRKLLMISGLIQEISFIAITLNPESNCTCREKHHSQFHWSTSTLPEQHTRHWMNCWKHILKITGTWMKIETCQMHGQASQDLFH